MISRYAGLVAILLVLCMVPQARARAAELLDYDRLATSTFWKKLYPGGGWSLFCGYKFNRKRKSPGGQVITIEHIYPVSRMAKHSGCGNRMQCRESRDPVFLRMEADLHNMYPAWQTVTTHRYDSRFGLVNGEDWRFDDCDLEWKAGVMEPRPIARGNIARAMLYMHHRYKIPVEKNALVLYRVWNRIDPPSKQEKARNYIIERLQGNRNPYIDKPTLAEQQALILVELDK